MSARPSGRPARAPWLPYPEHAVGRDRSYRLLFTAGPADLDSIHVGSAGQAEVQRLVIARSQPLSELYLLHLWRQTSREHGHPCADRVSVTPGPFQLEPQPVVAGITGQVPVQPGRLTIVGHEQVEVSVPVVVADR